MKLANSCTGLVPIRHALDIRQQHLLAPDRVAIIILRHRKREGSKFIPKLRMRDGRPNHLALKSELAAGIYMHIQWWIHLPSEDRRQSDLGYAALRSW